MNSLSLKDKVIIVTGGTGLIGASFVRAIIEQEGTCIIADKNSAAGKKLCVQIKKENSGAKADFFTLDIISERSVISLINYVYKKYKRIDALVNSAYPKNRHFGKNFESISYRDFCDSLNLHLGGYFLSSQKAAIFFKKQGYGNIINIASIYGVIPPRFQIYKKTNMVNIIEFAAIKSAIIHMTKYIAKYFKGCNIRANCISPGGVLSNQPKVFLRRYKSFCLSKGMLDPLDLEGALLFLLSDISKMVNGQNIIVDDGFTL